MHMVFIIKECIPLAVFIGLILQIFIQPIDYFLYHAQGFLMVYSWIFDKFYFSWAIFIGFAQFIVKIPLNYDGYL
jgi:hypothetical protein